MEGIEAYVNAGSARTALPQHLHRLVDATLPRFGGLCPIDRQHMPALPAVREPLEEPLSVGIGGERIREVGGDLDRPWLGVELDIDIDLVARRDASGFAVLPAEGSTKTSP